jgi:hypothetical protein
MSVDGRWELVISTPIGEQKATLEIASAGSVITGTMTSEGETPVEISDGKLDGDKISWSMAVTTPMKLNVKVTAEVSGNEMKGKLKAGVMPGGTFTATRAA